MKILSLFWEKAVQRLVLGVVQVEGSTHVELLLSSWWILDEEVKTWLGFGAHIL